MNSYYETFEETLFKLKTPLPLGFSRGKLIDTLYDGFLAGYVYMTFAIPMQLADPIDRTQTNQEQIGGTDQNQPQQNFPDPSKMSPDEMMMMMVKGLEVRSAAFSEQMRKSPKAIQRLIDLTKEMDEMKLFS